MIYRHGALVVQWLKAWSHGRVSGSWTKNKSGMGSIMKNLFADSQLSVQAKINLAVVFVFIAVMAVALAQTATSEKALVLDVMEQQTKDAADSYFDSINTMMLTGTFPCQ